MTLLHSVPLLEIRAAPQGVIAGYASVFGGIDSHGDSVVPGAFRHTLDAHKTAGTAPVMLWAHDQRSPVGRWTELDEDGRGLRVEGLLNLRTEAGRQAFEHCRAGDLTGLSIGYRVPPGGSQRKGDINVLQRVDLAEISLVTLPSKGDARIDSVKAQPSRPHTLREFETALEELGFSRREARGIAAKGFQMTPAAADTSTEIVAALRAATQRLKG